MRPVTGPVPGGTAAVERPRLDSRRSRPARGGRVALRLALGRGGREARASARIRYGEPEPHRPGRKASAPMRWPLSRTESLQGVRSKRACSRDPPPSCASGASCPQLAGARPRIDGAAQSRGLSVRIARMRVWVDLTNTAHVQVLRPLVELLEEQGHEVELTARPLSQTRGHARPLGTRRRGDRPPRRRRPHRQGARRSLARAAAPALGARPALRLRARTRLDRPAPGLPAAADPEHDDVRLRVGIGSSTTSTAGSRRACSSLTRSRPSVCAATARRPPKLVQYPGLKEEYFLADFEPDPAVLDAGSASTAAQVALRRAYGARPMPSTSAGRRTRCCRACSSASPERGHAQTVVHRARRRSRPARSTRSASRGVLVPRETVDGRSLVAFADLLVSAGGTMNREAAVLGTPVWSIFEGRPGAVDEQLSARAACASSATRRTSSSNASRIPTRGEGASAATRPTSCASRCRGSIRASGSLPLGRCSRGAGGHDSRRWAPSSSIASSWSIIQRAFGACAAMTWRTT